MPAKKIEELKQLFLEKLRSSKIIVLATSVIIIAFLLYYFRGVFVAATVNGKPILRLSLIKELEKQNGRRVLDSLITQTLILQEAKKQGVTVDKKETDAEIARIEANLAKQGQTLDGILIMQGLNKETLIEQIRLEKLIEKLLGKDVKVSEKEIEEYIEKNQENMPEATDAAKLKEA
ncbi:MAG: SurA N-terminal domain-containing protein, partial [Candidatus Levybacteria bacterium]|nr:SurA N-terminal domain-containing protein [Candidatus Levybacteria bacterium]